MAKNITLMGANYPDVPAVQLPKTGGGTARFVDPDEWPKIQNGRSTQFSVPGNGQYDGSIQFPSAFSSAPKTVVANVYAGTGVYTPRVEITGPNLDNITATGFGFRVRNDYSAALTAYLTWIAIE